MSESEEVREGAEVVVVGVEIRESRALSVLRPREDVFLPTAPLDPPGWSVTFREVEAFPEPLPLPPFLPLPLPALDLDLASSASLAFLLSAAWTLRMLAWRSYEPLTCQLLQSARLCFVQASAVQGGGVLSAAVAVACH